MKSFLIYSIIDCIVNSFSQCISNRIRINTSNCPTLCENTLYRVVVICNVTYINVFVFHTIYDHTRNDFYHCISYDHIDSIHKDWMTRCYDVFFDKDIVKYKI